MCYAMSQGWGGWVLERANRHCAFPLVLFSYPQKTRNVNCEGCMKENLAGTRGKVKLKMRVTVVERGFPHISARGYIIILKINV